MVEYLFSFVLLSVVIYLLILGKSTDTKETFITQATPDQYHNQSLSINYATDICNEVCQSYFNGSQVKTKCLRGCENKFGGLL